MPQHAWRGATLAHRITTHASHADWRHAVELTTAICVETGPPDLIESARRSMVAQGVLQAVRNRDDQVILDWLLEAVSFQGIGDAVARGYIDQHGSARADELELALAAEV